MNDELVAAGARIFGCRPLPGQPGEVPAGAAHGKVVVTDGPYMETKEHVGGFIILKAANLDEALAWGRKFALACRTTVEIRPFLERTAEDNQHIPGIGQD